MKELILATTNQGKLKEIKAMLKDIDINVNDKEWSKVAFDNLFTTPSASDSSSATAE